MVNRQVSQDSGKEGRLAPAVPEDYRDGAEESYERQGISQHRAQEQRMRIAVAVATTAMRYPILRPVDCRDGDRPGGAASQRYCAMAQAWLLAMLSVSTAASNKPLL